MDTKRVTYIEIVRHKTMNVLSTIFEGDMIEVWAAYIAIYPNRKIDIDVEALPEVMKLSETYK